MDLLVATTNEGKVRELEALLEPLGVTLHTPRDFPDIAEATEDGETFEDNALKKARHWHGATGLPTLADDSGLMIDALEGEPGVRSARYAPTVEERNAKVLERLRDVPRDRRTARFVCSMAFIDGQGQTIIENGACEGLIHDQPEGEGGFGYDPIFWVTEKGRTMAQVEPEEKNLISHRALALARMRPRLEEWARGQSLPRPEGPASPSSTTQHYRRLSLRAQMRDLRWAMVGYQLGFLVGVILLVMPYTIEGGPWELDESRRALALAIKIFLGIALIIGGGRGLWRGIQKNRALRSELEEVESGGA